MAVRYSSITGSSEALHLDALPARVHRISFVRLAATARSIYGGFDALRPILVQQQFLWPQLAYGGRIVAKTQQEHRRRASHLSVRQPNRLATNSQATMVGGQVLEAPAALCQDIGILPLAFAASMKEKELAQCSRS